MARTVQIIGKVLLWLTLLLLLVAPVGLVYTLSTQEMEQYQQAEEVILQESAYGAPVKAIRMDVHAYVIVDGRYISDSYAFQELNMKEPGKVRWLVSTGQYVQKGQVLGLYGQEQVLSEHDGILREISAYSSDSYLRFTTMEKLKLECSVSPEVLQALTKGSLTTEQGEMVTITGTSPIVDGNGNVTVWLDCPSPHRQYGAQLQQFKIMTGQVFKNALVLDEACVYQKDPGADSPWYARQVSASGYFLSEDEITVGYINEKVACVTGIEEGDYFDSGYKAVIGGT